MSSEKVWGGESSTVERAVMAVRKVVSFYPQSEVEVIPSSPSRIVSRNCLFFPQYMKRARQMHRRGMGGERRRRQRGWLPRTKLW